MTTFNINKWIMITKIHIFKDGVRQIKNKTSFPCEFTITIKYSYKCQIIKSNNTHL